MVDVAQLVRALVCGTRGRGFESHLPPHKTTYSNYCILGCSQAVRHQTLTLACGGSNPPTPASLKNSLKDEFYFFINKQTKVWYKCIKFEIEKRIKMNDLKEFKNNKSFESIKHLVLIEGFEIFFTNTWLWVIKWI